MAGEIIYVCKSKNNKNIREGELKILKKKDEELYFEFGESEDNIKKRFYDDIKTLNEDFEALTELKKKEEKNEAKKNEKDVNNKNSVEAEKEVEEEKNQKPSYTKRSNLF